MPAAEAAGQFPSWWSVAGPVLAAVVSVVAAILTSRASYRAAERSNENARARLDHDRDAALDARTDRALEAALAREEALRTELVVRNSEYFSLVERHHRLRVALLNMGIDPDNLPSG